MKADQATENTRLLSEVEAGRDKTEGGACGPASKASTNTVAGQAVVLAEDSCRVLRAFIPCFILYVVGVVGLMIFEGWPFLLTNYVVVQVLTTIGYGDFTVTTESAKVFMAFYALATVAVLGYYIQTMISSVVAWQCDALRTYLRKMQRLQYYAEVADRVSEEEIKTKFGAANQAIASATIFILMLFFGTAFFRYWEHCSCSYGLQMIEDCDSTDFGTCMATGGFVKSWASAFYMSCITLTTVGFGDYQPRTSWGRVIGCFWMLFGVVATGTFLSSLAAWLFEDQAHEKFTTNDLVTSIDIETFKKIDRDNNGVLTRGEFLAFTLVKYGLVDEGLLDEINRLYDDLDQADPQSTKNAVTLEGLRTYQAKVHEHHVRTRSK